jgi:lycopene beta-cyclase
MTRTASPAQADIAIVGAGCAGLSLARQLVRTEKTSNIKACLYGPISPAATNGHSWGFWATQGLKEQAKLAGHSWQKWQVITAEYRVTQTADAHPYCRLDSRDWLTHCLESIDGHIQHKPDNMPASSTQPVFDSRPPNVPDGAMLQHFKGVEIKTIQPCFSPDTAILMDFRCDQSRGIHFIYLLPYSPTEALVESTMLSPKRQDDEFYIEAIENYLADHWDTGGWQVNYTEQGCIPMAFVQPLNLDYLPIGANGGCVRPSSGYAFAFIQKQTDAIIDKLISGGPGHLTPATLPQPISRFDLFLDRIFLHVIRHYPEQAAELFARIAAALSGDEFARFMSGLADFKIYAKLITAMPIGLFLKALWDTHLMGRDNTDKNNSVGMQVGTSDTK